MKLEEVELVESPVRERKVMSVPDSNEEDLDDKEDEKEAEDDEEAEDEKETEDKKEAEDDEFSFAKFASLHFQGSSTHSHIQQRLRKPLLYHEDEGDTLASVVLNSIMFPFKVRLDCQLGHCVLFFFTPFFLSPPGQFDSMVDHTKIYGRSSRAEARTCFCYS